MNNVLYSHFFETNLVLFLVCFTLIHPFSCLIAQENTIGTTDITWDATDGYTIFSSDTRTFIVNNCGQIINSWESEYRVSNAAYLLENGDLLRTGNAQGFGFFFGGIIEKFDWEGELLWRFEINNDDYIQHHDIAPLPNGNILALCYNFREPIDAWHAGALDTLEYWSTSIFEIEPLDNDQANIVWEWHLWDHLTQNIDSTRANYHQENRPELFDINEMTFPNDSTIFTEYVNVGPDWMHMNSIDYNQERDEILLSSRDHNEIFIIDHSTTSEEAAGHVGGTHNLGGDFIYRFGKEEFYGQHDAHWVNRSDYDENAILVFNNGFRWDDQSRFFSSVDMFIPAIDSTGKYKHFEVDTFQVLLKLDGPDREYSEVMGSAQILEDDRILICNSDKTHFLEFDLERNVKWRYVSPLIYEGANNQGNPPASPLIFRAKRIPVDHPAFENDWTLSDPIEMNFDIDSCLGITSVSSTFVNPSIQLFPNPANQYFKIAVNQKFQRAVLYNTFGQAFKLEMTDENQWDIGRVPNGLYMLLLIDENGIKSTNKLIVQH